MLERPLLVLSDTHLALDSPEALGRDLAAVIVAHPTAEILLAGDVFDLSFAPSRARSEEMLVELLSRTPDLRRALHDHVGQGSPVTWIPGNHDAALGDAEVAKALLASLELTGDAPLTIRPWFVRRNDVHIEHGHVYDPDNAPIHPLSSWDDRTEPLGIALTRRFVAPVGARYFSHASQSTPVDALASAFRVYGRRAPSMIARYFQTAIRLCVEMGSGLAPNAQLEVARGSASLASFARDTGLADDSLQRVLERVPRPTHLSRRDVFFRLYFDRVLATLLGTASLAALPRRPTALSIALGSFAYLAGSTLRGKDRYGTLTEGRLREGAERVRELTGARTVVFGHTHLENVSDGYVNTGSFAYPRRPGRPYALVERSGSVELRRSGCVSGR